MKEKILRKKLEIVGYLQGTKQPLQISDLITDEDMKNEITKIKNKK